MLVDLVVSLKDSAERILTLEISLIQSSEEDLVEVLETLVVHHLALKHVVEQMH